MSTNIQYFAISACTFISIFIFFTTFIKDAISVKVVALHVPSSVRKGAEVELACLYELGNSSLYSLKWFYRANETDLDEQEFFRYTPTIVPHKQYFPLEGINVNVNKSEAGRVVIMETNGKTTGKYKCEISIDGTFQTVAAEKLMTVLGNASNSMHNRSPLLTLLLLTLFIFYENQISNFLTAAPFSTADFINLICFLQNR